MTQEKFSEIKKHLELLDKVKRDVKSIDSLINGCSLRCTILGSTTGGFNREVQYDFYNKPTIIKFLMEEKTQLELKLSELEKEFSLM